MLTTLELENFKGISARQRIDFAPITLLFGRNSAGKSTVMHALLYLHELVHHGTADVDRTELGGATLELGGFARLVHKHDNARAIVIRAAFPTSGSLDRFGRAAGEIPFPELDDQTDHAWIEFTVRVRETDAFRGPILDQLVIGVGALDTVPLLWVEAGHSLRDGEALRARVNMAHPLLGEAGPEFAATWAEIALPTPRMKNDEGDEVLLELGDWTFHPTHPLLVFPIARSRLSALPALTEPLRVVLDEETPETVALAAQVRVFLEMVIIGTTTQLGATLRQMLYVGPLRSVPTRGSLYERTTRATCWADGLASWELLMVGPPSLLKSTNDWLRRLDAGCEVRVQRLYEPGATAEALGEDHIDGTVKRLVLLSDSGALVLPNEVGAGIAQVVPVVVAALAEPPPRVVAVEQPELHVHPALQARLGDLVIEASRSRAMLIETHSEHLMLRLMRRIRETNERAQPGEAREALDQLRRRLKEAVAASGVGTPEFSTLEEARTAVIDMTPDKLAVLYVERIDDAVRISRLRVGDDGQFLDLWPRGFFDERFEELYGAR